MPQRRYSLPVLFLAGSIAALLPTPLQSQTAVPDASGRLVFKANARTVIVDVVVSDRGGHAVQGLRKQDFELAEDGHSQQISFFEEHTAPQNGPVSLPDLPPNIFTNVPRVKPVDAVTVLLLDSLNTPLQDQSFVRAQMLKFLGEVKPGRRMALFTLGNRLRYIQGFTADPAVLVAALNRRKGATGPQASPLLPSNAQEVLEQKSLSQIAEAQAANPSPVFQQALQALQQYEAETASSQNDQRVRMTLDALQQLGQYLAGIPGRKNVVWFSGSFPLNLLPNPELSDSFSVERNYGELVRKADDLLAAAEVAIYPVAAQGLETAKYYGADQQFAGVTTASLPGEPLAPTVQPIGQQALQSENNHLQGENIERNAEQATMEQIARETGGEAFYNTNGLNDALDRVADHGSRFYTLAYTPANIDADGKFRKLQVKVVKDSSFGPGESYKLAYRHGYYAAGAKSNAAAKAPVDPLHPFMGPGMPPSTQILFAMRVKPGSTQAPAQDVAPEIVNHPTPVVNGFGRTQMQDHAMAQPALQDTPAHAGDNPKLKGPTARYSVDFVVAARGLQLDAAPNGRHHGALETTLLVYDQDGKPLNWLVRELDLDLDAARYAQVQANGLNFHLEIDVPKAGTCLRSGVYDLSSNLAGTLELPLQGVLVAQAPGLKAR